MRDSDSDSTVEKRIENLQGPEQAVRVYAATVLGTMGEEAEAAVPALIELLERGDAQDRRLAALTLGEIGPAAEVATPALLEAAEEDEDEGVVAMAMLALGRTDLDVADDVAA